MRRLFNTKKRVALLVAVVTVGAAAIGAYAFISAGGSGSGTATAGTATTLVIQGPCTTSTANQTQGACGGSAGVSVTAGIVPGGSEPVSYSIYNPNPSAVVVSAVSASSIVESAPCQTDDGGALAADFSYVDGSTGYPVTIAAGKVSANFAGTLKEADDGTYSQNDCLSPNSTTLNLKST